MCGKCKIEKDSSEFNKSKRGRLGLHNHCRLCAKETKRKWYENNQQHCISYTQEYTENNPDKVKETRIKHYEANSETILEKNRIRRKTPHARALANKARNKIYNENPSFKIAHNMRTRVRQALKGIQKSTSTELLLGCTFEELKIYLESQFQDEMTWDNYSYKGWHIDHIRPCASFDLTDPAQQATCFHYTNLQPLWAKDNISKGNRT